MFKKLLKFYTDYFAAWVIVFGVAAYFWPRPFKSLQQGMDWFFVLTMFGIGVVLKMEDFERIVKKPAIILIGTAAQYGIMPFGSFIVAKVLNLPSELAVGLILTGSAPGAMASNVMSYIAKADVAYSVSLTTVSTLLCPILTPGLTLLLAGSLLEIPFWNMMLHVLLTVIAPLFVGFGVRHYLKNHVEKVLVIFPAISATFIIFITSLVIALNKDRLGHVTGIVLAATVILNVGGMLGGYAVGSIFRMQTACRRTLAIEVGMQNAGLGTVLALAHFGEKGQMVALPAAVFVFVCIITASIAAAIWQRRPPQM